MSLETGPRRSNHRSPLLTRAFECVSVGELLDQPTPSVPRLPGAACSTPLRPGGSVASAKTAAARAEAVFHGRRPGAGRPVAARLAVRRCSVAGDGRVTEPLGRRHSACGRPGWGSTIASARAAVNALPVRRAVSRGRRWLDPLRWTDPRPTGHRLRITRQAPSFQWSIGEGRAGRVLRSVGASARPRLTMHAPQLAIIGAGNQRVTRGVLGCFPACGRGQVDNDVPRTVGADWRLACQNRSQCARLPTCPRGR